MQLGLTSHCAYQELIIEVSWWNPMDKNLYDNDHSPYLFLNQEVIKNWLINMRVPKISAETNPVKRCWTLLAIFSEMPASWKNRSNNSRLKLEKFFEKSAKYHQIHYESSSFLKHLYSSREVVRAYRGSSCA